MGRWIGPVALGIAAGAIAAIAYAIYPALRSQQLDVVTYEAASRVTGAFPAGGELNAAISSRAMKLLLEGRSKSPGRYMLHGVTDFRAVDWEDPAYGEFFKNEWCDVLPRWEQEYTKSDRRITDLYPIVLAMHEDGIGEPGVLFELGRIFTSYLAQFPSDRRSPTPLPSVRAKQLSERDTLLKGIYSKLQPTADIIRTAEIDFKPYVNDPKHFVSPDGVVFSGAPCSIEPTVREFLDGRQSAEVIFRGVASLQLVAGSGTQDRPGTTYTLILGHSERIAATRTSLPDDKPDIKTEVTISRLRLGRFDIKRPWYRGTAITALKSRRPGSETPLAAGMKLWGRDGEFSLLPVSLLVAYEPEIELQIPSESYERLAPWLKGESEVRLMTTSNVVLKRTDKVATSTGRVVFKAAPGVPQVIAVLSLILPNGEGADGP